MGSSADHGRTQVDSSSIVKVYWIVSSETRVNRSMTRIFSLESLKGFLPLKFVVSTTSVSPSQWPRGSPIHWRMLGDARSEEHTSELQSHSDLVCRLLLEKKKKKKIE